MASIKADWCKYTLDFKFTAITSRESLRHKDTYFIRISANDGTDGWGEAGLFRGLSCDDRPDYERKLSEVCANIERYTENPSLLTDFPSIRFAVETALCDLRNGGCRLIVDNPWARGNDSIRINGLIWMGDVETMRSRLKDKLAEGFRCIKIKIGGISFDDELRLLSAVRDVAPYVELRLDANGAFHIHEALSKLDQLARFDIHSIEQPIRQGQYREMCEICRQSPIPVALDEELIGLNKSDEKRRMLDKIRPAYIILKPTLCGGMEGADEWIRLAEEYNAGWWATSALESNIGLNAIAQWVAAKHPEIPQGLGTGLLYKNNIASPLTLRGERLSYDTSIRWGAPV